MTSLKDDIRMLVRTRHALVHVRTMEEEYVIQVLREAAGDMGLPILEWSVNDGLFKSEPAPPTARFRGLANTSKLLGALTHLRGSELPAIYIFKDAIEHLKDSETARLMRDVGQLFAKDCRTLFLLDASTDIPQSLRHLTVPLEAPLPELKEIDELVRRTVRELRGVVQTNLSISQEHYEQFLESLRGLTRREVVQVVNHAILDDGQFDEADLSRVQELKQQRFQSSGALELLAPPADPLNVGGMRRLRGWLEKRRKAFTPQAREFGLEPPRGLLLLGVQGCGKSMMAKYIASYWSMPLIRLNAGALYDKFLGETERQLREALKSAEAMAPCLLWVDEIEKAFGGGQGPGDTDGGTSKRLFGDLLTWMQDHAPGVFTLATANDISVLPPELMRKGRFDEIFFVDLPDDAVRKEIFTIHLTQRGRAPELFDFDALAAASEGFSGAEIEQAIVSSLYSAFAESRDLDTELLLREVNDTQPLSVIMQEKLDSLRTWASGRCVLAN